jgi:hypothetical protein
MMTGKVIAADTVVAATMIAATPAVAVSSVVETLFIIRERRRS